MQNNDLKRNAAGYADPTAYEAIKNINEKEKRVSQIVRIIKMIADIAGFEIEERIILRDKTTGEIWR